MAKDQNAAGPNAGTPRVRGAGGWQKMSTALVVYRGTRQDNGQAWLLTFTDLAALMLTFFVLLFSMSTIETAQWQNLVDALSPKMSGLQEVSLVLPSSDKSADEVLREPGTDLDYLMAVLRELMAGDEVLTQAEVTREAQRLVISVPGDLLFASGSTALGGAGGKAIFALAGVLRNLRNVIEVAGHADPVQPRGTYPSNWELSLARAAAISGMLNKVGYQGDIVVRGYGDARYQDIDPDLAPEDRMARARRVDILIHSYATEAR